MIKGNALGKGGCRYQGIGGAWCGDGPMGRLMRGHSREDCGCHGGWGRIQAPEFGCWGTRTSTDGQTCFEDGDIGGSGSATILTLWPMDTREPEARLGNTLTLQAWGEKEGRDNRAVWLDCIRLPSGKRTA